MPQETAPLLKELDDAASEPLRFRPPGKVELLGLSWPVAGAATHRRDQDSVKAAIGFHDEIDNTAAAADGKGYEHYSMRLPQNGSLFHYLFSMDLIKI